MVDCLASLAFLLSNGGYVAPYRRHSGAPEAGLRRHSDDKDYKSVAVEEDVIPPLVALLSAHFRHRDPSAERARRDAARRSCRICTKI